MKKEHTKNICIIILIAIITLLPMFFSDYTNGHDTKFHIANIISYTQQIKSGYLIPKILGNMAHGFGYATGVFYPPLAHLIASYFNVIINSPFVSIYLTYFIGLLTSGLSMYFLSIKISKNSSVGLVSSAIYMLFPYHICNIYIRDAQAESILFAFLPLIINGLYELFVLENTKKFYILFISGYVLCMLSHLTLTVFFTVIILILLALNFKKTIKNIKPFLIASIFILLITSFFTVPLVLNKISTMYRVFEEGVMVQGTWGNGLSPKDYINVFVNYKDEKVKYFIDICSIIMLVITFINYKKYNNKFYNYVLIFGIISFVISTRLFPWDIFPKSFRIFQFPWRFVSFVSISVSLLSPLCLNYFLDNKVISYIICLVLVLLSQPLLHSFSNELIDLNNIDYKIGEGWESEYLPSRVYNNLDYYNSRDHLIKGADATIILDSVPKLKFSIDTTDYVTIELPRIYYKGYTLKDENGNFYNLSLNENGFIEANVGEGVYTLDYTTSKINNLYVIISLISLIGCVIFIWIKK